MKVNLNVNLEEAILLSNVLKRIDVNFIQSRIHKYEMDNMSIEDIRIGIKRIIKSINNFDKEFDMCYKEVVQLMEWLGFQDMDDTQELMGISIVTYEDEMRLNNIDSTLCRLYGDLLRSIKRYKLNGGEI